jgi:nuclear pore complex protein Nup155
VNSHANSLSFQLQLLDAICALPQTNATSASISQLNSSLIDISQLYSDFAEPYALWECQLAIIHCAGHPDQVQTIERRRLYIFFSI